MGGWTPEVSPQPKAGVTSTARPSSLWVPSEPTFNVWIGNSR